MGFEQDKKTEPIVDIGEILTDYHLRSSTMGIDALLDMQDSLSVLSYRLAEEAADAKTGYNTMYFNRKIGVNRSIQAMMMKEKISHAKASTDAELQHEETFQDELIAEARAYKSDLLLGQVNKVLSAMQQRISYLKKEKTDNP